MSVDKLDYYGSAEGSTLPDYQERVRALAAAVLEDGGEECEMISEDEIARMHQAGMSVLSAAAIAVANLRQRKFERGGYDYQEKRVAEYLASIIPDAGAGMDPVGFLMASHAALSHRSAELRNLAETAGIDTSHIL